MSTDQTINLGGTATPNINVAYGNSGSMSWGNRLVLTSAPASGEVSLPSLASGSTGDRSELVNTTNETLLLDANGVNISNDSDGFEIVPGAVIIATHGTSQVSIEGLVHTWNEIDAADFATEVTGLQGITIVTGTPDTNELAVNRLRWREENSERIVIVEFQFLKDNDFELGFGTQIVPTGYELISTTASPLDDNPPNQGSPLIGVFIGETNRNQVHVNRGDGLDGVTSAIMRLVSTPA